MKSVIVYTTKYGSVEKVAKLLESKMEGEVVLVNLMKEEGPDPDEFDQVILGGPIYMGRVQKQLTGYIAKHLPALLKKKIGLFICGGLAEPKRVQELQSSFPPELYEHAVVKEEFGYEFQVEKLRFFDKLMLRMVAGVKTSKSHLSFEKIDRFAETISAN